MVHDNALSLNRCESILQPGKNCTILIDMNKSKGRRRWKISNPTVENVIIYRCHFCSHQNLIRGTPKGYVKATLNSEKPRENQHSSGCRKVKSNASLPLDGQNLERNSPATTLPTVSLSVLDLKRRKRNRSSAKKVGEPRISSAAEDLESSIQVSSKRREKSWPSLKEIAESSGQNVGKKTHGLNCAILFLRRHGVELQQLIGALQVNIWLLINQPSFC